MSYCTAVGSRWGWNVLGRLPAAIPMSSPPGCRQAEDSDGAVRQYAKLWLAEVLFSYNRRIHRASPTERSACNCARGSTQHKQGIHPSVEGVPRMRGGGRILRQDLPPLRRREPREDPDLGKRHDHGRCCPVRDRVSSSDVRRARPSGCVDRCVPIAKLIFPRLTHGRPRPPRPNPDGSGEPNE